MTYVKITQKNFEFVLSNLGKSGYTWKKLNEPNTKEDVYMVSINDIYVKIFSSIVNGVSRNVGSDAIRVVAWNVVSDRPMYNKHSKHSNVMRVNRTKNWSNNLKLRIQEVVSKIINAPRCKICGGMMVEMKGRFGMFNGCINYRNHGKFVKPKNLQKKMLDFGNKKV